jgi:hypothetical protein
MLSTISTLSSSSISNIITNNGWGPYLFSFTGNTSGLTSFNASSNIFTYTGGTGTDTFKNGEYQINTSSNFSTTPGYMMFDTSTTSRWFSGLSGQSNTLYNGSSLTYDRDSYIWATGVYQGGRADGTATWSTNGYTGEFFDIKYPFNYVLTKIYIKTSGGNEFARSPKNLNIFGSNDGTTWVLVSSITTAITNNSEYAYNVSNTTKYIYYRFVASSITGGNNTGTCFSLVNFRTEGQAYSL